MNRVEFFRASASSGTYPVTGWWSLGKMNGSGGGRREEVGAE